MPAFRSSLTIHLSGVSVVQRRRFSLFSRSGSAMWARNSSPMTTITRLTLEGFLIFLPCNSLKTSRTRSLIPKALHSLIHHLSSCVASSTALSQVGTAPSTFASRLRLRSLPAHIAKHSKSLHIIDYCVHLLDKRPANARR